MALDNIVAINVDLGETRVALIENGMIAELLVERAHQRSRVGNIYKGRVTRVLPGMQAAFVDIGLEKHAFLHASDLVEDLTGEEPESRDDIPEKKPGRSVGRSSSIRDSLKEGQYLPVQVAKDQIGTKGCRITTEVSLPGRHLVYMPLSAKGGISRKIESEAERRRLARIMAHLDTPKGALIARTVASGAGADALEADAAYLCETWEDVLANYEKRKKPGIVYEDLSLPLRVARDKFNDSVARIIVDSEDVYNALRTFIDKLIPSRLDAIERYTGDEAIFEAFGIETEIKRALERVVELPSGGTLVIDQGEALTAVDVNTGRFVGKGSRDQEETIVQTNLEAVEEIAYQVRFRNIGGLIVLDLIDMDRPANRQKVLARLKDALKDDRARTSVNAISRFGLVEMTRERTTESLGRLLHERCPWCDGTGHILSRVTVANEILREIPMRADAAHAADHIEVEAHPHVLEVLKGELAHAMDALRQRLGRRIDLVESRSAHPEKYAVHSRRPEKE